MLPRTRRHLVLPLLALAACTPAPEPAAETELTQYATVPLTADLSGLTDAERRMIPILIEAAQAMDEAFWLEAWGDPDSLRNATTDPRLRRQLDIDYGPWDRLRGDAPFLPGVGAKPKGARFYPADLTAEEFERWMADHPDQAPALRSLYTIVTRTPDGGLGTVPYYVHFAAQHERTAAKLREAAALAPDPGLRRYLELRADALLNDNYRPSDIAWMEMTDNGLDMIVGPIETYEDQLMGYKAAHTAYVLVKDRDWSRRLARYAGFLPELQRGIPVPEPYRRETPGGGAQLGAYDVVYYAGQANAGSKTIAVNLPNDEEVQLQRGTRRLQLKNAMRAKFDSILVPIAGELIAEDQRQYISFDSFFGNVMFHEVAHGLGIKNTINGKGTVRESLKEHASALEEAKADILGLYMSGALRTMGELPGQPVENDYVTFLASIFRSVRFGASSAHGRGNMIQFSFFQERGAFSRDEATGTYRVDFDRMREAVAELAGLLLTVQGDGDYDRAGQLLAERGVIPASLKPDLDRLGARGIPVDVVFEQGMAVLNR